MPIRLGPGELGLGSETENAFGGISRTKRFLGSEEAVRKVSHVSVGPIGWKRYGAYGNLFLPGVKPRKR